MGMSSEDRAWSPEAEYKLTSVAPELWIARHPLVFYGLRMVTCMTVVRQPSGSLWVHSPIPLNPSLIDSLNALGQIEYVVAPNRLHHLYSSNFVAHYPNAKLHIAPNLATKNPAIRGYPLIQEGLRAPWHEALDSVFIDGNAELNETVFLHRESSTLIITDLAVRLGPWDSFGIRTYARFNRCYGRLGHSFLLRTFFKNRGAAARSLERVLRWDFKRIVLAHGPIVDVEARQQFESAFNWLLGPGR
jgi:hypothetical protein